MIAILFLFALVAGTTIWFSLPKKNKNLRMEKDMADRELIDTLNKILDGKSNWELVGSETLGGGSNDRVVFNYCRSEERLKVTARADGEIIVRSNNFEGPMSVFDEKLVSKAYSKYEDLVMKERIEKIHKL